MKRIKQQLTEQYDWIIGIANGGIIPALYLAYECKMKNVDTFCASFYKGESLRKKPTVANKDYTHFQGKNILLVDDLVDTGKTMSFAIEYIKQFHPKILKTATIYKKKGATFTPDYFIAECERDVWIDFPWENESSYSQIEGIFRKV